MDRPHSAHAIRFDARSPRRHTFKAHGVKLCLASRRRVGIRDPLEPARVVFLAQRKHEMVAESVAAVVDVKDGKTAGAEGFTDRAAQ